MRSVHRGRVATILIATALSGMAAAPAQGAVAPAAGQAASLQRGVCGANEVCLWAKRNFQGPAWRWSPRTGSRPLPANLRNNVSSFYANANACFIDYAKNERHRVYPGHYGKAYDTNFGERIDHISTRC